MSGDAQRGHFERRPGIGGDVRSLLEQLPSREELQAARNRIEQLEAVEEWARGQLPLSVGDRVRLTGMATILANAPGWRIYREALADGATATVAALRFATHRHWVADIVLDREWSVSDSAAYGPWWNGPGEPPAGYKDGRRGLDDRRHTWTLPLARLEPITAALAVAEALS